MVMEQNVKERVVGAAVLMALAVIFVPMILSGPSQDTPRADAAAPSHEAAPREDAGGFSSRIVPLDESTPVTRDAPADRSPPPAAVPEPEPEPEPAAEPETVRPAPRTPAPMAKAPVAKAPPREPPDPPPAASSTGAERWAVQLGSFANPRNAHALRDRLKAKGWTAFAVSSGQGQDAVTRVYVGAETSREGAEKHVSRLYEETRLKGIVVRHPGR